MGGKDGTCVGRIKALFQRPIAQPASGDNSNMPHKAINLALDCTDICGKIHKFPIEVVITRFL